MNKQLTFQTKMTIGIMAACAVGLGSQYWDLEISQSISKFKIPGDFRKAIGLSEAFAHTSGGVVIFATLLWIDMKNRSKLWRAAFFTLICGVAANAAKLLIPRIRPHSLDQAEFEIATGWQTWGVPWTGSWFDEQFRSFPSGHSATAMALAIGLTQVYPRGKWIFALIAGVACFQRLESSAHFLSDIMGGVVITMILAIWYWKTPSRPKDGNHCEADELIQKPTALTIE